MRPVPDYDHYPNRQPSFYGRAVNPPTTHLNNPSYRSALSIAQPTYIIGLSKDQMESLYTYYINYYNLSSSSSRFVISK